MFKSYELLNMQRNIVLAQAANEYHGVARNAFITVLEAASQRSGCQHYSGSGKSPLLGCRLLTSCLLTHQTRVSQL